MTQDFTNEELAEWLDDNQHQIAAFVSRSSQFQGRTAQDIINYRSILLANSNDEIQKWKNWEQTSTSVITFESEKAKHYTNLVSLAGYAGFFWLWDKVTPLMPHIAHVITGLLVTISLGIFVFSEVFLLWATGNGFLTLVEQLDQPLTLKKEIEHYTEVKDRFRKLLRLIWPFHFWLSAVFGVLGFIYLLWFFVLAQLNGQFLVNSPLI